MSAKFVKIQWQRGKKVRFAVEGIVDDLQIAKHYIWMGGLYLYFVWIVLEFYRRVLGSFLCFITANKRVVYFNSRDRIVIQPSFSEKVIQLDRICMLSANSSPNWKENRTDRPITNTEHAITSKFRGDIRLFPRSENKGRVITGMELHRVL